MSHPNVLLSPSPSPPPPSSPSPPPSAYDSRADELAELIVYVSNMRRSFGRQLDGQLHIIQQQQAGMQQQARTIDEQREYIDELAWQIRDLRDSIRRVKESVAATTTTTTTTLTGAPTVTHMPDSGGSNGWSQRVQAPQPAPRRQLSGDQPPAVERSRITIEEIIDSDSEENTSEPTTADADNIYEPVEDVRHHHQQLRAQPRINTAAAAAETRDRRTRYALTRLHQDHQQQQQQQPPLPRKPCPSGRGSQLPPLSSIVDVEGSALCEAIARLQVDRQRHDRDSLHAENAFDAVLLRSQGQLSVRRRNSQRGSSKVACSLVSNIEEDYWPPEELAEHDRNGNRSGSHATAGASSSSTAASCSPAASTPSKRG